MGVDVGGEVWGNPPKRLPLVKSVFLLRGWCLDLLLYRHSALPESAFNNDFGT